MTVKTVRIDCEKSSGFERNKSAPIFLFFVLLAFRVSRLLVFRIPWRSTQWVSVDRAKLEVILIRGFKVFSVPVFTLDLLLAQHQVKNRKLFSETGIFSRLRTASLFLRFVILYFLCPPVRDRINFFLD